MNVSFVLVLYFFGDQEVELSGVARLGAARLTRLGDRRCTWQRRFGLGESLRMIWAWSAARTLRCAAHARVPVGSIVAGESLTNAARSLSSAISATPFRRGLRWYTAFWGGPDHDGGIGRYAWRAPFDF